MKQLLSLDSFLNGRRRISWWNLYYHYFCLKIWKIWSVVRTMVRTVRNFCSRYFGSLYRYYWCLFVICSLSLLYNRVSSLSGHRKFETETLIYILFPMKDLRSFGPACLLWRGCYWWTLFCLLLLLYYYRHKGQFRTTSTQLLFTNNSQHKTTVKS